jgi:hypothetical protein
MKNGKMMIRSSYMIAGGIIFLFALIFSMACANPVSGRLPPGFFENGGGGGEPPIIPPGELTEYTIGGNVTGTLYQGNFTYNDTNATPANANAYYGLWVEGEIPTDAIVKWFVKYGAGEYQEAAVPEPNPEWPNLNNAFLSFPTLAYQLEQSTEQFAYLAAGDYYIKAEVYDAEDEQIGYTPVVEQITVSPLDQAAYEAAITVTMEDSGGTTLTDPIELNLTDPTPFEITVNVEDSFNDATYILARSYSWELLDLDGTTILDSGDVDPTDIGTDGAATATISIDTSTLGLDDTDVLPGTYTYTLELTATLTNAGLSSGFTTVTQPVTVEVTKDGNGDITFDGTGTTITQGAFTWNDSGTPTRYTLAVSGVTGGTPDAWAWKIKGPDDDDYIAITGTTPASINLLGITKTAATPNTYAYNATAVAYLPEGVYEFIVETSNSGGPTDFGYTNPITITVEALPAFEVTVEDSSSNDVADTEIPVANGDIGSISIVLTVTGTTYYDASTILGIAYTYTITGGTITPGTPATTTGTITINDTALGTPAGGETYTVMVIGTVTNSGTTLTTDTVTFTIAVAGP